MSWGAFCISDSPSAVASSRPSLLLPLAAASALLTVVVGAALRWALTGWPLPLSDFPLLRSAHSHLGYYGLLFPLMWLAWRRLRLPHLGLAVCFVYALAVGASFVGFAREGYGLTAIVASTLVLGVWLLSAWKIWRGPGWLASVGPAIVVGALCIPPVAVMTGRDPELAQALVQGFLTVLLLGAVLPSLLQLEGMGPPRPWLWLGGVVLSGAFFGPFPHWALGVGPVILAWLLGVAAWRSSIGPVHRASWLGLSGAMLVLGLGLLPRSHSVMIGGFHFLVLGPVLWGLSEGLWRARPPRWVHAAYLSAVALMGGSVLLQHWEPGFGMLRTAAWSGAVVAVVAGSAGVFLFLQWLRVGDPGELS